jgi:hypothetical protein
MIGTGCAGIDIMVLSQDAWNTAQGQIPGNAGTRGPPADNEYLSVQRFSHLMKSCFCGFSRIIILLNISKNRTGFLL